MLFSNDQITKSQSPQQNSKIIKYNQHRKISCTNKKSQLPQSINFNTFHLQQNQCIKAAKEVLKKQSDEEVESQNYYQKAIKNNGLNEVLSFLGEVSIEKKSSKYHSPYIGKGKRYARGGEMGSQCRKQSYCNERCNMRQNQRQKRKLGRAKLEGQNICQQPPEKTNEIPLFKPVLTKIQLDLQLPTQLMRNTNQNTKQKQKIYLKQTYTKRENKIRSQIKLRAQLQQDNISYDQFNDMKQKLTLEISSRNRVTRYHDQQEENKDEKLSIMVDNTNNNNNTYQFLQKKYGNRNYFNENIIKNQQSIRQLVETVTKKKYTLIPDLSSNGRKIQMQIRQNRIFQQLVERRSQQKRKISKNRILPYSYRAAIFHDRAGRTLLKIPSSISNDTQYQYLRIGY